MCSQVAWADKVSSFVVVNHWQAPAATMAPASGALQGRASVNTLLGEGYSTRKKSVKGDNFRCKTDFSRDRLTAESALLVVVQGGRDAKLLGNVVACRL